MHGLFAYVPIAYPKLPVSAFGQPFQPCQRQVLAVTSLREKQCARLGHWTGLRLSQIDCAVIVTGLDWNRGWQALQVIDYK
jgi:hypothetical protein